MANNSIRRWWKKKRTQKDEQNDHVTGSHQQVVGPHFNRAHHALAHASSTQVEMRPGVRPGHASERTNIPQRHQTGETSQMTLSTVTDTSPLSNQGSGWKRKHKEEKTQQEAGRCSNAIAISTNQDRNKRISIDSDSGLVLTVQHHPHIRSNGFFESPSQSTCAIVHSQGNMSTATSNCKTTTSTSSRPAFTASAGPSDEQWRTSAGSRTFLPPAVASPSKQSEPRAAGLYSSLHEPSVAKGKSVSIDCEMVGSGPKGSISQVARCSIVSYDGDLIYDKFIRPPVPITDYRTRWSGIRRSDLHDAIPYAKARKEILKLIIGKVLIGHAIHNDLKVLSYSHPKSLIRDTSRIPLLNIMAGFKENEVVSLKRLTKALLRRDIQVGRNGHSSVDDATATMDLYKLVEVDWERTLAERRAT